MTEHTLSPQPQPTRKQSGARVLFLFAALSIVIPFLLAALSRWALGD